MATAPESLTGYDFLAVGGIHFGFSLTMPTAVVVKGDGVGGVTSTFSSRWLCRSVWVGMGLVLLAVATR